jgi:Leucine-rich repeat (LRR) protein
MFPTHSNDLTSLSRWNEPPTLSLFYHSRQKIDRTAIDDNQLGKLPDSISLLQNLSSLNLMNNQLKELPDSITHLQNLSSLNLMNNPLVNPPLEIARQGIEAIREYFREKT